MKTRHNITLGPEVTEWLEGKINNKSQFIEWLIRQHAGLEPQFKKETGK